MGLRTSEGLVRTAGLVALVGFLIYALTRKGGLVSSLGGSTWLNSMALAIQDFEGWNPTSRSYRNNNPGNLKFAGQPGAIAADDEGHAIFSSFSAGWNALLAQLRAARDNTSAVYNSSMTLLEFFRKYAEGNSYSYALFVAGRLGVPADTRLSDLG